MVLASNILGMLFVLGLIISVLSTGMALEYRNKSYSTESRYHSEYAEKVHKLAEKYALHLKSKA